MIAELDQTIAFAAKLESDLKIAIAQARNAPDTPDTVGAKDLPVLEGTVDAEATLNQIFGLLKKVKGQLSDSIPPENDPRPKTIDGYKEMFKSIDLPKIVSDFDSDEQFSKFRIAGANPMVIKGATKAEVDELTGFRISDETLNKVLGTYGDSLERAGNEGRLCVVNFDELSSLDTFVLNIVWWSIQ